MNRSATRYWLRDWPLSARLQTYLSLVGGLVLATILLYVLLLFQPEKPGRWYELAALLLPLFTANLLTTKLAVRRITEPLERLVGNPEHIKGRDWNEPVLQVARRDETGAIVNTLLQIQRNVVGLNEDKEFFYQGVSHGFKALIMTIQNCCTVYQDDIYGSEAINVIMRESLVVKVGIGRLLYISSFDHTPDKQSDFRSVKLRRLTEGCRRQFRGDERGIRLKVDVLAGLTVSGNETAFQTIFDNLMENGLCYAASYIRMELTREKEGGYLLTMENDGVPIPQPTLNILFQKFHKGADGSPGLGPHIVKEIVQFHRGDIWVSNWADRVCFQLLLRREDHMASRHQRGTIRS